jgi:SecD/SecF fusion protein
VTERRNHLILVGLILLALIGTALLAVPRSPLYRAPVLGLDLQGGLEVVLQAVPPEGRELTREDLDRSLEIIRNRVDRIGVAEPEINTQGGDQIAVRLPGVRDAARAQQLIGQTARLELYDLQPSLLGPSVDARGFPTEPPDRLYDLLSAAGTRQLARQDGEGGPFYLFERESRRLVAGPFRTEEALLERRGGEVPDGHQVLGVPEGTQVITCSERARVCPPGIIPSTTYYYLFKHDPEGEQPVPQMTGEDLRLEGTRHDFDPQTGEPIVLLQFTDEGANRFHEITRAEAQRGQFLYNRYGAGEGGDPRQFNQNFAIVLDQEIRSFPSIDFRQYPDGIRGDNGAQITGIGDISEAQDLALVLQTGALPVEFVTLSETNISATLGEDSLRQAVWAAAAGLLLTALFLLFFYRFLGLVAVIGLGIYAALLYTAILAFNVTLTLPGFAGMILTIGVAADANIVIFERIKEEIRAGKSVRAGISAGYAKGFHTIVDANVVTAITAMVLFVLATAGVKGFALMLLVGISISMLTAVFATRAMLGLLAGFRWFDSPRFMGAAGQQGAKWLQIDFVGKRRIWFGMSALATVVVLGALLVSGLNLGLEFRGGTQITFATGQPATPGEVRQQAAQVDQEGAVIQGTGDAVNGRYSEFRLRTEQLALPDAQRLRAALTENIGAQDFSTTTVSPTFGRQIAESAIYAIFISLLLIVAYISVRFHWKFSLPVIAAMAHDVLLTVGVFSLTGRQVTTGAVAAVLTVLGYSIYDTIIIFDRIRENLPLMKRASFGTITNVSLWETIRRSLATTFSTLLPVSALFFFGGETLKDFAFALMVGITAGAYSSIFFAAPLLSVLKEREPEFARRDGAPRTKEEAAVVVEEATAAAADAPVPELAPLTPTERATTNAAKREQRRQRRRTRPHGRAR